MRLTEACDAIFGYSGGYVVDYDAKPLPLKVPKPMFEVGDAVIVFSCAYGPAYKSSIVRETPCYLIDERGLKFHKFTGKQYGAGRLGAKLANVTRRHIREMRKRNILAAQK